MKIKIELELTAAEAGAAEQLLSVLSRLADVKVSALPTEDNAPSNAPAPAAAEQSPGSGAFAPPTPAFSASSTAPAPCSSMNSHQNNQQYNSPSMPPEQSLPELIAALEYSENPEQVAQQLEAAVMNGPGDLFPSFMSAWMSQALNLDLPAEDRSAVSFVLPLAHTSPAFRKRVRDAAMPDILRHLTIKRPPGHDRSEYYVHAEVFAAMVQIELLAIEGALQTMCTLVRKDENRIAAITMLGKTVELCSHMITDAALVSKQVQQQLHQTVSGVTDEELKYDVEYICENMGWPVPA